MKKMLASLITFLILSSCATAVKTKALMNLQWKFKEGNACLELEDVQKLREELIKCQH